MNLLARAFGQAWDIFRDANPASQILLVSGYVTLMLVVAGFLLVLEV